MVCKKKKMISRINLRYLQFGLPILIVLFLLVIPRTNSFQSSPEELSKGILLDFLITIPVLFYFLIRKTNIPKITIIYSFIGGLAMASLVIPTDYHQLLTKVKYISIPLIEIGIVSMLIYKISRLGKSLNKTTGADFYDRLLQACHEVFPNRVGNILATEIAVIYYLFAPKNKKAKTDLEFTYYKKSGIKLTLSTFLFLISIETMVVHLLVSEWDLTLAWVLSIIGIYTMMQVFAIMRSMNKRLIKIDYESKILKLRYGFGSQTIIPFHSMSSIEKSQKTFNSKSHICLSLFDILDSNNIIIYLNEENKLQKIYGIEKKYKSISIFVDNKNEFVNRIEQIIAEN
jgi:hypothetical protein